MPGILRIVGDASGGRSSGIVGEIQGQTCSDNRQHDAEGNQDQLQRKPTIRMTQAVLLLQAIK